MTPIHDMKNSSRSTNKSHNSLQKQLAYVFILVGVGLLVGACFIFRSTNSFLAEAAKAEGTVIELVRAPMQSAYSTTYSFSPVVQFNDPKGQVVEFLSSLSSYPPSYSKGEKVEILYSPANPQNAQINSFFSLWGVAIGFAGLGGIFFLIGIAIIFVGAKRRSKD